MVERERRDLFFRSAVEHKPFSCGRDSIDQPTTVRPCDYIASPIQSQHADVCLIALEKERVVPFRGDAINLTVIARGYIQISGLVQEQVPYVFRPGSKIDRRTPRWIECRLW